MAKGVQEMEELRFRQIHMDFHTSEKIEKRFDKLIKSTQKLIKENKNIKLMINAKLIISVAQFTLYLRIPHKIANIIISDTLDISTIESLNFILAILKLLQYVHMAIAIISIILISSELLFI